MQRRVALLTHVDDPAIDYEVGGATVSEFSLFTPQKLTGLFIKSTQRLPVKISVKPFPEIRFDGEVFFVSPTLEASTRRLTLKAWVPNPGRKLQPGLFANLEVELAERPNALVIPDSAILVDQTGSFVWRIGEDGKAMRAPIEIGLRKAARVEIASGLEAGDRIVSAGTQKVTEGAAVVIAGKAPEVPPAESKL